MRDILNALLTPPSQFSVRWFKVGAAMDGVSWTDLNSDEQSAIAMLAAGASADLCDPLALLTLARIGLIKGWQLTPAADELHKVALLNELAA
jgi:hypothetical protein